LKKLIDIPWPLLKCHGLAISFKKDCIVAVDTPGSCFHIRSQQLLTHLKFFLQSYNRRSKVKPVNAALEFATRVRCFKSFKARAYLTALSGVSREVKGFDV
jgi:hypothetical protein